MTRSKPKLRPKRTGSCPLVLDDSGPGTTDIGEKLPEQKTRFFISDLHNPNDEHIDLESYSEASSITFQIDPSQNQSSSVEIPGIGDRVEESTFLSGGNVSSVQPEDSDPNDEPATQENRKLDVAATVMSWLDNYGQARGHKLGSHGTSLIIQADGMSRNSSRNSTNLDEVEVTSTRSPPGLHIPSPDTTESDRNPVEMACCIIANCHSDIEPLKTTKQGEKWKKVQDALMTCANLLTAIWIRSRDHNVIARSELFSFVNLCESLASYTLDTLPLDISNFINPVVRLNLRKVQDFLNLILKWCKEIQVAGKIENLCQGLFCWTESLKQISTATNDHLKQAVASMAGAIIKARSVKVPRYEIVLHDVIPTRTSGGWMFFGKVELRNQEANLGLSDQITVQEEDSGLRVTFMASFPTLLPCIDYGAIFHVVNRASLECSQCYRFATVEFLEARQHLSGSLIPPSYPKEFGRTSSSGQDMIMGDVVAQIIAEQCLEPTVAAIDEILRNFTPLITILVKMLTNCVKNIRNEDPIPDEKSAPFTEFTVPMATDANSLVFQTVRRFLTLGPLNYAKNSNAKSSSSLENEPSKSALGRVHMCFERGVNCLYEKTKQTVFSFRHGIQVLFAVSQLLTAGDFLKRGSLERSMKDLVIERLLELNAANKDALDSFRGSVKLVDQNIKMTEKIIDKLTEKKVFLGITKPARSSGVSFSHQHDSYVLIRYRRNSYIRRQAKQLKQSNEVCRYTRKYFVEPECEEEGAGVLKKCVAE